MFSWQGEKMIRRRIDTKPEIFPDEPACRIFGMPELVVLPKSIFERVRFWFHEDGRAHEMNCYGVGGGKRFIDTIRNAELLALEKFWEQFPVE
jgi:hypothetical protein